jgi:hypothetical protein
MERITNSSDKMTENLLNKFIQQLQTLKPNKTIELKTNGQRVKIALRNDTYTIYHNGMFINEEVSIDGAIELITALTKE